MRHRNLAFLLACFGLLTIAIASAPAPVAGSPVAVEDALVPAVNTAAVDPGVTPGEPDGCEGLPPAAGDQFTPAAICRLLPECFSNDDCDVRCGTSGGRCVHSKCPVRICKCN